ncbi:molybdopterin-dependent oxidoreductase [Pelomonas sp. KK5]|uniref:molybdopterin-containing oxidoreductase family protein n=1 Tax=Pelomonas sp. KK5 TaxID=1855730 RepID=UPI00097C19C0|nr:molybdopterin-dependent oxidoreductase [Pelomonas sp. KK5]
MTTSIREVHTYCHICEPGCGLLATVQDEKVIKLQPDREHPIHQGYSCHKGVHYLSVHQDPDRLDRPLRRRNPRSEAVGDFEPVSWDVAMAEMAARLNEIQQRHGPDALAFYQGNPSSMVGSYYANAGALMRPFRTRMHFNPGSQDCASKFAGSEAIFGSMTLHPIPDLLHADYFLCLGSNPLVSHMSLIHVSDPMEKIRAIRRRGGKTVFVNPRRIESSTPETGEVLLIRPDTDVYFLAGVLHEIAFHLGFDRAAAEGRGSHLDELLEVVRAWPIERVAGVTGLAVDEIRQVAREFHAAPRAAIYMSTGVNQGSQGALAYLLLHAISLLTGNLGRRGGNIYSKGLAVTTGKTRRREGDPFFDTPFGNIRTVGGSWPGSLFPDIAQRPEAPIKALLVVSGNPLLSMGGGERLRKAIEGLELVIVLDLYRSATAEMADYVLPATDWLEREDVNTLGAMGVQLEPFAQYTPAVVPPKGERRDDWWILARLAQAMGRPSLLDKGERAHLLYVEQLLAEGGLSIEQLKAMPCQTARLPVADPEILYERAIQNEDRRMDCFPAIYRRSLPSLEAQFERLSKEAPGQLKLIQRRTNMMINSWMHNLPALKQGLHQDNPLWMHPQDAQARGLFEGDAVRISSSEGAIEARLSLDDTLRPGAVAMTHGWGQQGAPALRVAQRFAGVNSNALSPTGPGSFDPVSTQCLMNGIPVEVRAAA